MTQSTHIYLIRVKTTQVLLAALTVKHDAHVWASKRSGFTYDQLQLTSMQDGIDGDKNEHLISWDLL